MKHGTTLTLDAESLAFVRAIAEREGLSIVDAVRKALLLYDHVSKETDGFKSDRVPAIYDPSDNSVELIEFAEFVAQNGGKPSA